MKIISLHVYGFGQLENVKIDNLADFQVFYGENEAGKSTIMAFIHAILFGFPTRQQTELRYEPKHNSKYGGNIKVFTEAGGFTVIERVKGKAAAGDVSVTFENGVIGGEELLKELLLNVDKGLFQAIFSFNLHGLQNIHQMKGEEIGRFLFSAGTLGTDRLAQADSELQKELDARFKPGGKKPLLNEKLQELQKLNKELNLAAARTQEYETLIERQSRLQQEMKEARAKIKSVHTKVENLNEWKKIEGFVKEENWTLNEINRLGEVDFPPRGIQRLEALKPLLSSNKAQMISLTERIEQLKTDIENLHPNLTMVEHEAEILAALEQYPLYQQLKLQEKQDETKLNQVEEKLAEINEKLHLSLRAEEVDSINTNIYVKEKAERLAKLGQILRARKQELDNSFNEEKSSLEVIESNIHIAEAKLIPEPERRELEKRVNEGLNRDNLEMKLRSVQDKIELYNNAAQQEKVTAANLQKQKQMQSVLFFILLAALGTYGWLTEQTLLLLAGIIGIIAVAIFMMRNLRKPDKKPNSNLLNSLLQEEKQLLRNFNQVDFKKLAELKEKLAEDQRYREQLQLMTVKHDQQLLQYEKVIKRFEEWELETSHYKQQLTDICKELKIPEYMAESYLAESFQLIEQYKSLTRERSRMLHGLDTVKSQQAEIISRVNNFGKQYLNGQNGEIHDLVYLLKNKLKNEQENSVKWKEKLGKLTDFEEDLSQLRQERSQLESDLSQLLHDANADNENSFYELGAKSERQAKLFERLEDIGKQIHHSFLSKSERESCLQIHDCEEEIRKHHQEAEDLQAYLTELQENLASINYDIQMIEEGGVYSELLHQFKQKKFELEEEAKEWAMYRMAQTILLQTIEKYKNVHLPRMLSKAEEYLSFLTSGSYQKILLHQSGPGFLIERQDGTIFEANELSQATTEQVYVAIRIALATTLYEKYHFPIIIDDSFVNFDAKRTQKIISLLQQLKQHQVLFFTCHQHLLQFFNKNDVLYLNNGATRHSIT